MRRFLAVTPILVLLSLGDAVAGQDQKGEVQEYQTSAEREFARQWTEVKEKYPLVAIAYLRREALAYQLADSLALLENASQSIMAVQLDVCDLLLRLGVALPEECLTDLVGPDYSSCFEPEAGEMPTPAEVQECIDKKRRTWRRGPQEGPIELLDPTAHEKTLGQD